MKLNETIRRLRRAKGLTQEQVAQALGVSGPAVNKWERGACCPDLALLAPLARLLDTDLNTLLSFREELTGAEIAAFTEELYTLAQSRGIDAAFLRAEELLHRWPGCDRLTISLAMTLNGLFFTLGVAEPEPYERRLEPLYRALADSEEPDIRDQALHLLIGRHMRREEYAAAEELLSALSDRWPHRDALQAGLLRRTGRGEEAAELWERRLLNAATEVYESLVSLQELALQAERLEDGARLAALIEETVERYALIPGVASSGRLQQAAAEGDKTAALSALRDMLEALNRSWDGGGLYPHLLPGTQVAVGSVLLPGLLLELQREPELAFLQDEPELEHLLDVFDGQPHHLVSIPRDIAQYEGVSKGLVARSVESLVEKQFLVVERDAADKRICHLYLTQQCSVLTKQITEKKAAFFRRLAEGIPEEAIATTEQTLRRFMENISASIDKS